MSLLEIKQHANISYSLLQTIVLSFLDIVMNNNGEIPADIDQRILYSEYCYDDVVEHSVVQDHERLIVDIRIVCTSLLSILQMHKLNLRNIIDYGVEDDYFDITVQSDGVHYPDFNRRGNYSI